MMKHVKRAVALILAMFAIWIGSERVTFARNSVGGSVTLGNGFSELAVDGRAEFNDVWAGTLGLAHDDATSPSSSTSNLVRFGVENTPDDANTWDGGLAFWRDGTNGLSYGGPTFGYNHSWFEQSRELFSLGVMADLFVYSADVPGAGYVTQRGRTLTTRATTVRLTQFHPSIEAALPLLDEKFVPFVSVGRYFYTKDPAALEAAVAAHPVLADSGAGMMTGNLYRSSWSLGASVIPDPKFSVKGDIGGSQHAIDRTWTTTVGLQGRYTYAKQYRFKLGVSHSHSSISDANYLTAGFTYLF